MSKIKKFKYIYFFLLTILAMLSGYYLKPGASKVIKEKKIKNNIKTIDSLYSAETWIILNDLQTYNKLSENVIKDLVKSMYEASKTFDIPIGLLHAIFRVESEYNFWVEHKLIKITINKKRITTKAVGLGGIVWEFWSDSLKTHHIAFKRSDLFIIKNNINATAAILRWITNSLLISPNNKNDLINKIIKRYYGAYSSDYFKKMVRVTSDLWLKRISRILQQTEVQDKS